MKKTCTQCDAPFETFKRRRKYCSFVCYQRRRIARTMDERFWARVKPAANGCHEWTGSRQKYGHGMIRLPFADRGTLAHRLAWELKKGPIPEGMHVLHSCDNPPCVNTEHLFLGTHADNMADKEAKNRGVKGSKHGNAKVTEAIVRAIRTAREPHSSIAAAYGIGVPAVRAIRYRLNWKHVA